MKNENNFRNYFTTKRQFVKQISETQMYTKLKTKRSLPADLEDMIDQYIHFLNTGEGLADTDEYYITEIMLILNWCYRERLLPDDEISRLRDYYQYGGIKKNHG